jgi:AraC-like DNA-binding protein
MPVTISRVKKYIARNLKRVHTIADVASHFEISAETLRKTFRREGGGPLHAYIVEEKLKYIKRKLSRTDLLCFEIIYDAGFRREDSAARTFRARTGLTMQEFRSRTHLTGLRSGRMNTRGNNSSHRGLTVSANRKCQPGSPSLFPCNREK